MIATAVLLGIVTLVLIAAAAHYRYWVRRLTVPLEYASEERIATPDGSAIELRRIPGNEGAETSGPPVLLVHGIAINHQNNDVLPDLSLARHLAAEGRDCWLLTLRSGRPDVRFRERALMRFDRMAKYDLPIGIARVLALTGSAQLDYVGFSMGGMLLYAALGRTVEPEHVRRVVIVGSPGRIRPPWPMAAIALFRFLPWWAIPTIPLRLLSRLFAFAAEWLTTPVHHAIYNPANVERGIAGACMMTIQDVPAALSHDFARFARHGGPIDVEGGTLDERLAGLRIPVLFFAGGADRLAPPDAVRVAFDAWGRRHDEVEKRFVLLSRDAGASADYGHGDLAIGRNAKDEIFAPAAAFLR